jgi:ArsR family transcriptional regulator
MEVAEKRNEYIHIKKHIAQEVKSNLPLEETLYNLADLFKLFGDTTRIKILYLLFDRELCVCDIATLLGITQSAISHQLKTLKANKLIKCRRVGKTVFYSLADDHVRTIIAQGAEHLEE